MHILILADPIDNQTTGIHQYTKNLAKALLEAKTHHQLTFIHQKENPFFEGTHHFIIPSNNSLKREGIRRFHLIPKLIKQLNPDIVLEPAHLGPFNLPKHIKRAVTIHDITPILFPHLHTKRNTMLHRLLLKKSIKNADAILTMSETTKQDIQKKYKTKAKITTTYESIEPQKQHPPLPKIQQPYILHIGTIEPRKNLDILIDAFQELKKSHEIPHKLVLAGPTGWKSSKTIKKAKAHKDIILKGQITDTEKASLLKHADIFVYPSLYEGFGLPPLEAMSYNIPVICSTGGSLKELYEKASLQFNPKDKEALKQHILSITQDSDLKEKLAKKGLAHSSTFTWEDVAKKTFEAFEAITQESS